MTKSRLLNVGIIQMPISIDCKSNLSYIEESVEAMMGWMNRPDLILGVELGISPEEAESIPGPATDFLCNLAKKHKVYLLPGTLKEKPEKDCGNKFYNTCPIIDPSGKMIAKYAKMVPWLGSAEGGTLPGTEYIVFDIPEKETKIGVQICLDGDFPEISRTEVLMGAEVLVQISMDPDSIPNEYRLIRQARAIENQVYYVYTNGVGNFLDMTLVGNSLIADPEGKIIYEAGRTPSNSVITLDLDAVTRAREMGNWNQVKLLKHLYHSGINQPYAEKVKEAPLFKDCDWI